MNTQDAIATVLGSGLSLLGLVYLYFWLYRDYRRDLLRTRLFTIRAELFDGAAAGRIDFNHPAYGLLRSTLNGFLRSGHRMGAFRLWMTAVFMEPKEIEEVCDFEGQWRAAAKSLDQETRLWLENLRGQAHQVFFKHLLATTGFLYLGIVAWLVVHNTKRKPRHRTSKLRAQVPAPPASFNYRLDSVALANGLA